MRRLRADMGGDFFYFFYTLLLFCLWELLQGGIHDLSDFPCGFLSFGLHFYASYGVSLAGVGDCEKSSNSVGTQVSEAREGTAGGGLGMRILTQRATEESKKATFGQDARFRGRLVVVEIESHGEADGDGLGAFCCGAEFPLADGVYGLLAHAVGRAREDDCGSYVALFVDCHL